MRPLTPKQRSVLDAIRRHQRETGLSPTLQELGAGLQINRVTVYGHVQALLQKGFLENLEPGAARGLDLTPAGHAALDRNAGARPGSAGTVDAARLGGAVSTAGTPAGPMLDALIPLVGRIAAGSAIEAVEDREEVHLGDFLRVGPDTYLLEVLGDSMINEHIRSGDHVLVQRDRAPQDGDIVVAVLEDETATLKRFHPQADGSYILQPANDRMEPIYCDRLEVRGVVTGVIRRY